MVTCSEFAAHLEDSLKAATRGREQSSTKKLASVSACRRGKVGLFHLISDRMVDEEFPGLVIVTCDDEVLSSAPCDLARLMSCKHEEAETRVFVHASDGAEHGMNRILPRTVDTYVVVIGISMAQKNGCGSLWFAFRTGTTFRYLDATAMAQALGDATCDGLPVFHALTGCDVT